MANIKFLSTYMRLEDNDTRYVVVLDDDSIWWFAPGYPWQPSTAEGLPLGYKIAHFKAYSRSPEDGTRYVAVLEDGTRWFAPNHIWEASSTQGLPAGYKIKHFEAYMKPEGTRYVVLLEDNSLWWYTPGKPWQSSPMDGLPVTIADMTATIPKPPTP